jgi:glycosyltransferase involved in cell wall biosynthesis
VRRGEELARIYASADVFVFPSRTDTFGNVILEAMASGCPVAAFPVTGPLDIIGEDEGAGSKVSGGVLSEDLRRAALACLDLSRAATRERALAFDWGRSARQFADYSWPLEGFPDHQAPDYRAAAQGAPGPGLPEPR